jgi:hypothetical protein
MCPSLQFNSHTLIYKYIFPQTIYGIFVCVIISSFLLWNIPDMFKNGVSNECPHIHGVSVAQPCLNTCTSVVGISMHGYPCIHMIYPCGISMLLQVINSWLASFHLHPQPVTPEILPFFSKLNHSCMIISSVYILLSVSKW